MFRVRPSNKKSFTLIELLVVVAIIAVLIALLLPSFVKTREKMKGLLCTTNLRTIYQGVTMYAQANQDTLPAGWLPNNDPNLNNFVPYIWKYIYPDTPWKSGDTAFFDRFTSGVFLCPLKPVTHSLSNGFISYGYNSHMDNLNISKINNPSRKFLLADGGADLEDIFPGSVCFFYYPPAGRVYCLTYRHQYQAMVLCADGHADSTDLSEIWRVYPTRLFPEE